MNRRLNLHSLRYRMIIALVISLCIAGAVYFISTATADYLVVKHYLSTEAYEKRTQDYADRFQSYVREEGLSSMDTAPLQSWVRKNPYAYISLYDRNGIIWESGWWDERTVSAQTVYSSDEVSVDTNSSDESFYFKTEISADTPADALPEYYEWFYKIEFLDGTFWVSVTDFSDEPLYDITHKAISAFSIFLIFPLVLIYSGKISQRVIRLTREVGVISSGSLDGPITKGGKDEISTLAEGVDTMRRSVIEQMEKEQIAWRANGDLITSMSHDIRTPLTVLLGYTGLIKNGQYGSQQELDSYIEVIDKKAVQLKELSDKLFRYFLVFGNTTPIVLETGSARELLSQVIGEHAVLLTDGGFSFEGPQKNGADCQIQIEPTFFKRLFDNIFSNIEKYGDPRVPCVIGGRQEEKALMLCISNGISDNTTQVESSKIGLKTCARAMEQMGGSFRTETDGKYFTAYLYFALAES